MRSKCRVPGCPSLERSRGLCISHYYANRRTGAYADLLTPSQRPWITNRDIEPLECDCDTPDPDPIHECRRCHRPHYPPGYVEALRARLSTPTPGRVWRPAGRRAGHPEAVTS